MLSPKDELMANPEDVFAGKRCDTYNKEDSFYGPNKNYGDYRENTAMEASFVSGRMTTNRRNSQFEEESVHT